MTANTEFTLSSFDAMLKGITAAGQKYTAGIGKALLAALYFANCENNAAPANGLVQALRKSTKQQAIIDLLEENGNLAWVKQSKNPGFKFFDAMHTWLPEDVAELRKVCADWESYKKAPVAKDYDAVKAVEQIIKTIESKQTSGKGEIIGADLKAALLEVLTKRQIALYGMVS